jgi:hypothetical protein
MSRAKEVINKKIVNPIKSVGKSMSLPTKLFSVGLVSLLGTLPLASLLNRSIMTYAQPESHQQAQALDPWSEALRAAQSKVQAATAPGAFGHGVPDLYSLTPTDMFLIFGIVAAGSLLAYAVANHLLNRNKEREKEMLKEGQLISPGSTH